MKSDYIIKLIRKLTILIIILLPVIFFSCKSNNLSGIYVCDQSAKNTDTTLNHTNETCVVTEFDFKGKSTVGITMGSGQILSSYVIDEGYILVKGEKSDFLLKIQNQNTLVGEGVTRGIYRRK